MVKAYLRYEQTAGFGVIASGAAAVQPIPNDAGHALVAAAGVDALVVWNARTCEAVAKLGNRSTRKAGPILALAVSDGGETLAAGYSDGSIRLWHFNPRARARPAAFDELEPEPIITFNGHRSGVSCLAFPRTRNAKGTAERLAPARLVSGSNDGDLIVWSTAEEVGKFRIPAHQDAVTAIALLDDRDTSYIVSGSKDGLIRVYDIATQHCVQVIVGHRAEVWAMQLDPTNSVLLTGSVDAEVRAYLVRNRAAEQAAEADEAGARSKEQPRADRDSVFRSIGSVSRYKAADRVVSLACTVKEGVTFAVVTAADASAELFRLRYGAEAEGHRKRRVKRALKALEKEIRGKGEDEGLDSAVVEQQLKERSEKIDIRLDAKDVLFSVRQLRLSSRLRSMSFLTEKAPKPALKGKNDSIGLQFLVQTRSNTLETFKARIVNTTKAKKRKRAEAKEEEEEDSDEEGNLQDLVSFDFAGHRTDIRSISLGPDETTLLTTSRRGLKLWNIASQRCIRSMELEGYGLCTSLLGADGSRGAVGVKEGWLMVYDLGSGTVVAEKKDAHNGAIWDMCLDEHIYESNTLLTCGADKKIHFWNIENVLVGTTGQLILTRTLEMADEVLRVRVAYTRERPVLVASLLDSTVRAYYLDSLEPYLNFYGHRLPVMAMDISSDGQVLATGAADKTVKLWGMDFGDCRRSLRAHSESIVSLIFQPKTHYFFSGSRDGSVKYWDGDKFELINELEGQRGEVWAMDLSDDGEIVVSASHDKMIRVWRRTDEPLFLEEEKDKRMDDMFESTLIDEDLKAASKARHNTGFMEDASKGEATAAGKRSLDTIKGGERLLEALELCEEEVIRQAADTGESPNPMLLGMSPRAYMLRTLEQIKRPDLEEALHILPLDAAIRVLQYCSDLLDQKSRTTRLSVEMLSRAALYLIKLHHSQITAGAASRKLISDLHERLQSRLPELRSMMGFNCAALHFWKAELADRDDTPFRDAATRAVNLQHEKSKKLKASRRNAQS